MSDSEPLDGIRDLMAAIESDSAGPMKKSIWSHLATGIGSFVVGAIIAVLLMQSANEVKSNDAFEQLTRDIARSLAVSAIDLRGEILDSLNAGK